MNIFVISKIYSKMPKYSFHKLVLFCKNSISVLFFSNLLFLVLLSLYFILLQRRFIFQQRKASLGFLFFFYFMWFSSPRQSLWIIGGYQDIRRGITPRVPSSLSDTDSCQASGFAPLHLEVTWKFWRDDTTKNKGVKSSRVLFLFFTTSCCRNKF